jgi:hypothetical protein
MQSIESEPFESFVVESNHRSASPEERFNMDVRGAYVLEDIEQGETLRDSPVVILCPNCRNKVHEYLDGLPRYLSWFRQKCSECEVELRRWSGVAVDAKYTEMLSKTDLAILVQTYWDRHLWEGITTAEGCPRTREFTEAYATLAAEFGWDWEPSCPLCRRSIDDIGRDWLDYHHWQREPDQGVCLCRSCHDSINNEATDTDVDWEARSLGLRNKHDLQILRLAAREHLVEPASSIETFAKRLVNRYNLVQHPDTVAAILNQASKSDEIKDLLEEELPSTKP